MGKLLITVTTLILLSSQLFGSNQYTGTFSTQTIRLLWMACYQGVTSVNATNLEYNGALCDCVVNTTREKYTAEEVKKQQGIKMQNNYTDVANKCKIILDISTPTESDFS